MPSICTKTRYYSRSSRLYKIIFASDLSLTGRSRPPVALPLDEPEFRTNFLSARIWADIGIGLRSRWTVRLGQADVAGCNRARELIKKMWQYGLSDLLSEVRKL
jgi:hypothetical protein